MKQASRGRTVTLITNFEPFLIDPHILVESLKKSCASAASGEFALFEDQPFT